MDAFDRETLLRALNMLGERARGAGLVCEIAVFGGSAIMLASDIRNATADVDAVFKTGRDFIYEVQGEIAAELGLPSDWINQAVKRSAPPVGGADPNLLQFGEYPTDNLGAVGLRVFIPTPAYLLAMKIFANRLDTDLEKKVTDESDIIGLMKVTGITTYDGLISLMKECYPNIPNIVVPRVHPRIEQKIRGVLDKFNAKEPSPSWNAGTGPATRDSGRQPF